MSGDNTNNRVNPVLYNRATRETKYTHQLYFNYVVVITIARTNKHATLLLNLAIITRLFRSFV